MSATDRQRMEAVDPDLASKYEILDVLGGGGMGRVLRARHRQLKTLVAIKLLLQDLNAGEAVTRFLREARAAARIRSAHVAHVMDAGILRNGQPYIVMEYLRGQDLARRIVTSGRVPVEEAVAFTLQALEAIAEAHSLHIIHRDIKPGNLFATRIAGGETFIKVLDFGLAKTHPTFDTVDPGVTERGAVLGTPSYMSPEQFINAQEVDARTDIWGIGATLFELLTGTPPFRGNNLPQIYTAVMHRPIPSIRSLLPELPEELDNVVATCLTRERELRYANVAELASALAPFAKDSDREHIARIDRVVKGFIDRTDDPDPTIPEVGAGLADGLQEASDAARDVSTFRRTSRHGPQARPNFPSSVLASRRARSVWLLLLAAALIGSVGWAYNSRFNETRTIEQRTKVSTQDDMAHPSPSQPSQAAPQKAAAQVEASTAPTNQPAEQDEPTADKANVTSSAPRATATSTDTVRNIKVPVAVPPRLKNVRPKHTPIPNTDAPPSIFDIYP